MPVLEVTAIRDRAVDYNRHQAQPLMQVYRGMSRMLLFSVYPGPLGSADTIDLSHTDSGENTAAKSWSV